MKCLAVNAHNQHEGHSIGYYFKSDVDDLPSYYASHRGVKCLDWFMDELTDIAMNVFKFLDDKKPMFDLTLKEQEEAFMDATVCHICKKPLEDEETGSRMRVRDHCHITGCYRGAAHQSCNLNYQISRGIPVMMHNLSGYDSHLLIKKLVTREEIPGEITIIPCNSEKYISFIKKMSQAVECKKKKKKYYFDSSTDDDDAGKEMKKPSPEKKIKLIK